MGNIGDIYNLNDPIDDEKKKKTTLHLKKNKLRVQMPLYCESNYYEMKKTNSV